ncbi:MAG: hypothetical protein KF855_11890 [Acidobacteria bacterium]|nr:hypothetical protein [Acidobacteriota bacterium]
MVNDLAQRPECADILDKFAKELEKKGKLDETEDGKTFIESVFDNLKKIEVNTRGAGSGARTDGNTIWVRDYSHLPTAHQNALYAKYIIQELVHAFRQKGTFTDARLGIAAESILNNMEPTIADKIREGFKATGYKERDMLGHYLINQFCQYTQEEVNNGQPQ